MEKFIDDILAGEDPEKLAEALRPRTAEEQLESDRKRADAVAAKVRGGDDIEEYELTPRQRRLVEEALG